jgi:septum formation protein
MNFPYISEQNPLILASASPRRKRLLTQAGLPFLSMASQVEEEGVRGEPEEASRILAERKAFQVCSRAGKGWILGADTMVVIDDEILGKPRDREDARRMLWQLSGREHEVITGLCILNPLAAVAHSEAVITLVSIKGLKRQEIEDYIETDEPFGKAGSYAIQGIGSFMVKRISGSYTNVVGLPICALIEALFSTGALKDFPLPHKPRIPEKGVSGL